MSGFNEITVLYVNLMCLTLRFLMVGYLGSWMKNVIGRGVKDSETEKKRGEEEKKK